MNQVNLIGKVKEDISYFKQTNGDSVSKFKVSIESKNKKCVEIDCVAWNSTADKIHEDVRSNDLVSLTGKLNPRVITQNGNPTYIFEVVVDRINLILPEYDITKFE